jgi:hypothetical protein
VLWTWALKTVPWKTILFHAPAIVEAARKLYGTTLETEARPRPPAGLDALRRAVEDLEQREAQQAALFSDLAREVEAMATAVEILRARVALALAGSSIATVVAIVAAILAWRR